MVASVPSISLHTIIDAWNSLFIWMFLAIGMRFYFMRFSFRFLCRCQAILAFGAQQSVCVSLCVCSHSCRFDTVVRCHFILFSFIHLFIFGPAHNYACGAEPKPNRNRTENEKYRKMEKREAFKFVFIVCLGISKEIAPNLRIYNYPYLLACFRSFVVCARQCLRQTWLLLILVCFVVGAFRIFFFVFRLLFLFR